MNVALPLPDIAEGIALFKNPTMFEKFPKMEDDELRASVSYCVRTSMENIDKAFALREYMGQYV